MANEISLAYMTGATLYAVIRDGATGQYLVGATPEAFVASHWGTYARSLVESGTSGQYFADFPAAAAGDYVVDVYLRAGGSPATSDGPPIGSGPLAWSGTAPASLAGTVDANIVSVNGTAFAGPGVPTDRAMLSGVLGSQAGGGPLHVILPSVPAGLNVLLGSRLRITSGSGRYQERTIVYSDGTNTVGLDRPWAVPIASGDAFRILYDNAPQLSADGGNVAATVYAWDAGALAQLFTLDSGQTYAGAVAGSVVKEIVANAGGGSGSADTPGTTTLLARLTITRATNLDNLDALATLPRPLTGTVAASPAPTATAFTVTFSPPLDAATVAADLVGMYVKFGAGPRQAAERRISAATIASPTSARLTVTPPFAAAVVAGEPVSIF